jgi:mTERF domain-containing protein
MKAHGFSETHLAKLIQSRPGVLHCRVEGNLKPKFEFLTENGVVGQLLPELILSNTHILRRGLDSQIKPCFEFLKSVLGCNENVLVALKHSSWLLTLRLKGTMQPNYDLLIEEGVAVDRIAKLIMMDPRAIQNKRDKMISTVSTLKDLGLEPNAPVFIHALRAMLSISESTRKKKIEVLKSLGWSEKDIWHAFKRHPLLLGYSEEKIRAGMDFFVNTLKLGLQHVIACPQLLTYSIDKRLLPRYNVLKILESKKLIKKDLKIKNLLKINEKEFLKNDVYKYVDDIPGLLDLYGGADKAKKIHT